METSREQASRSDRQQERNPVAAIRARSPLKRYGFALACLALGFVIRFAATPIVQERNPYTFFVPAVLLASWYGAWGPGLLATFGGFLIGDYFFTGPAQGLGPYGIPEVSLLMMFLAICGCGILLLHLMHGAQARAVESTQQALRYSERLEQEVAARENAERIA